MENKDLNSKQNKAQETQNKLEKMRSVAYDQEKCKEIAQKLCAYISKNS